MARVPSPSLVRPVAQRPPVAGSVSWATTAIFIAVMVAYLPVWHAGFIWDDDSHLTANPCIVGPQGFLDIWTSPAGFYFPLTTTSFWLEHAIWGLHPLPYHVVNVLLHALSAALLFRVLRQLAVPGAWLGAMLWALHPVQVESVAWVSELKNTQSAVFYLLAISFYLRWLDPALPTDSARRRAYGWSLLCGLAAILSKSSTVMLPVVLGLCTVWVNRRWRTREALSLVPFVALSAAAGLWTIWEQSHHSGASGTAWNQSLLERVSIAGRDVWFYLGKLAWPHPLSFIYPRWDVAGAGVSLAPTLAVIGVFAVLIGWRRQTRPVLFAATYFVVSLFPVLDFFDVYYFQYSFVGDHFQYLASMGILAGVGAALTQAITNLGPGRIARPVAAGVLLVLGGLTWQHSGDFRNDEAVYRSTLAHNPACWLAQYNLGNTLRRSGRSEEAIPYYEKALQANPSMADAQTALGISLQEAGRNEEAIAHFTTAVQLDGKYLEARNHLGVTLAKIGRLPDAAAQLEAALRLQPGRPDVHNNLGNVLRAAGRMPEAIAQYEQALRLDPKYAEAHVNLGNALATTERIGDAITHYRRALELAPDAAETHNYLGIALAMSDQLPEAIGHFQRALQLNPNLGQAHLNLAMALDSLGRSDEAKTHYEAAQRLGAMPSP